MPYPSGNSDWLAVVRRVMDSYWWGKPVGDRAIPPLALNNENISAVNAAGTGLVGLIKANTSDKAEAPTGLNLAAATKLTATDSVGGFRDLAYLDASDNLFIGGGYAIQPTLQPAVYTMDANAALADQPFFIANPGRTYRVVKIFERHKTAGNDASAVTLMVRKCTSGQAVTAGTALMTAGFDLKGTASTTQTAALVASSTTLTLNPGEWLAVDYSGTLTTLAGVCVTVWLLPSVATLDVTFAWNANAGLVDAAFFVANDRYRVAAASYVHTTAGSSTPVVQLVKDTSTNAPGAGTDLLTNNTNTGFNCAATANVPQIGTLTATAASLLLDTGNRLSVDFAGTMTALAGVVMTVSLTPIAGKLEIPFYLPGAPAAYTDQVFLLVDRDYEVTISSEVHAVAAGSTSTAQVVKDTGTDAPGAGTDLLLAAYDLNGTANTVDPDLIAAAPYTRRLAAGDALSFDFANAVQSSSGLCTTTQLKAA